MYKLRVHGVKARQMSTQRPNSDRAACPHHGDADGQAVRVEYEADSANIDVGAIESKKKENSMAMEAGKDNWLVEAG